MTRRVGGPAGAGAQRPMATTDQDTKAVVRRYFEAWNAADLDAIDDIVAPDVVGHNPVEPMDATGPDGEKQLIELYHTAFPDAKLTVEELIAEGDTVAVRYTATGTHEGAFMGIEPTGSTVEIAGFEFVRIEEGVIAETWGLFDAFGLMQQLGAVEAPAP